jgi:hypothetical protein
MAAERRRESIGKNDKILGFRKREGFRKVGSRDDEVVHDESAK